MSRIPLAPSRSLGSSAILCLAALALAAPPAGAQVQRWARQLGTAEAEEPTSAAPDGSGGVLLCGFTLGSLGGPSAGDRDAWVARYDAFGNQAWLRQLGTSSSDGAGAILPDGSGGAFVAGSTSGSLGGPNAGSQDAWLARLDGAGTQLWIRQLGTAELDGATAAAPDGAGGLYVCGSTGGSLGGPNAGSGDAWLARYDSAGVLQWIRQLGSDTSDWGYAVSPDGAGGVFVGGGTSGDLGGPNKGDVDVWLARYDSSGNQIWIVQFGTYGEEYGLEAAADGAGGVYLCGDTMGSLGGPFAGGYYDGWVARYSDTGTQLWARQLGTEGHDDAYTIAANGSQGCFVGGGTGGLMGGTAIGKGDAWLARFDLAGNREWVVQFGTTSSESARATAGDGAGGVFVSGLTTGDLGGPFAGATDVWIARFDDSCGVGSTYCTASSTSIPGCQAAITGSGSPSLLAPDDFVVSSGNVPGQAIGICIFGANGPDSTPIGSLGGQICVQSPFFRTAPRQSGGSSGSCNGLYEFRLSDLIDASPVIVQGAQIHAEVWARDPANADGFLLSNGLTFTVCP